MNRYTSDFSNQVHQLTVTVSRHITLKKDCTYYHQEKPLDISWEKLLKEKQTNCDHVVHYVIRDHYSALYYAESHPLSSLITIETFLHHAWVEKKNFPFSGMPEYLMFARTILDVFPSIINLFDRQDIKPLLATSGFASGLASVKDWETRFKVYLVHSGFYPNSYQFSAGNFILMNCDRYKHYRGSEETHIEKYRLGLLKNKRLIPIDFPSFCNFFDPVESGRPMKFETAFKSGHHIDVDVDPTQHAASGIQYDFGNPKQEYIDKKKLQSEISQRPGFRQLISTWIRDNYYAVYSVLEREGRRSHDELWVLECEKHKTKQYFRTVTEAGKVGRGRQWCSACNSSR